MFVTNWISPTKIQKISEITNFFRHYFLSRTEVIFILFSVSVCASRRKSKGGDPSTALRMTDSLSTQ